MKNNLKKEILELFCGLENGEIDCNTETEIKLDKILENNIICLVDYLGLIMQAKKQIINLNKNNEKLKKMV